MIRRLRAATAAMMLLLAGTAASAHDEYRVIGTISASKGDALVVKAQDGRVANIRVDAKTEVSRDTHKATRSELKVGQFVVIQAYGDDYSDLLALEIKLVSPPAKPAK